MRACSTHNQAPQAYTTQPPTHRLWSPVAALKAPDSPIHLSVDLINFVPLHRASAPVSRAGSSGGGSRRVSGSRNLVSQPFNALLHTLATEGVTRSANTGVYVCWGF